MHRYWMINGDIFFQSWRTEEHEIFLCVAFGLNILREANFTELYMKCQNPRLRVVRQNNSQSVKFGAFTHRTIILYRNLCKCTQYRSLTRFISIVCHKQFINFVHYNQIYAPMLFCIIQMSMIEIPEHKFCLINNSWLVLSFISIFECSGWNIRHIG